MTLTLDTGREMDVRIEWAQSSCVWLRIGEDVLVGFTVVQFRDADLALRRIEIVAHVEFAQSVDDTPAWWSEVVAQLEQEFAERKHKADEMAESSHRNAIEEKKRVLAERVDARRAAVAAKVLAGKGAKE